MIKVFKYASVTIGEIKTRQLPLRVVIEAVG